MILRTAKLHGIAHPKSENNVSIVVGFNNETVYSGPACDKNAEEFVYHGTYTIATWDFDASIHGAIPISISVVGGDLTFANILMTHVEIFDFELNWRATWPGTVPNSAIEILSDKQRLSDEDFLQKYLLDKENLFPDFVRSHPVSSKETFCEPNINTVESDGKTNVIIDGVLQVRNTDEYIDVIGDWHYLIRDGQTLTCDFDVLPPALN